MLLWLWLLLSPKRSRKPRTTSSSDLRLGLLFGHLHGNTDDAFTPHVQLTVLILHSVLHGVVVILDSSGHFHLSCTTYGLPQWRLFFGCTVLLFISSAMSSQATTQALRIFFSKDLAQMHKGINARCRPWPLVPCT